MNFLYFILIASTLITTSFIHAENMKEIEAMKRKLEPVHSLMERLSVLLGSRHALHVSGITLGTPGGVVDVLGMRFQRRTKRPIEMNDARKLLVDISTTLIESVNKDSGVYKLLRKPPFSIRNVDIAIFLQNEKGRDREHPDLSVISVYQGMFTYESWASDPEWILKTISSHTESYEEAKAILEGEKGQSPCAS